MNICRQIRGMETTVLPVVVWLSCLSFSLVFGLACYFLWRHCAVDSLHSIFYSDDKIYKIYALFYSFIYLYGLVFTYHHVMLGCFFIDSWFSLIILLFFVCGQAMQNILDLLERWCFGSHVFYASCVAYISSPLQHQAQQMLTTLSQLIC